jgi:putative transposon-encoded protein
VKALKLADGDACCQETHYGPRTLEGVVHSRLDREVKFNLYGEEVIHKKVTASGSCGRVYLPLAWVGKKVKIIRIN